jgi:hypothetical protein
MKMFLWWRVKGIVALVVAVSVMVSSYCSTDNVVRAKEALQ